MPEGILRGGYEALERGDAAPLLDLLSDDFEWVEPDVPGYPLAGVHVGAAGLATGVLTPLAELLDGLTFSLSSVVVGDGCEVVAGVMRGTPIGAAAEWELPFAHVYTLSEDGTLAVRGSAYFDRSRLTLAAGRRALADAADELLDQAAEIRVQWGRLGDALRAAGVDSDSDSGSGLVSAEPDSVLGVASARLVAVDMAQDGSSRDEVEAYLRDELGVDDAEAVAIVDEVFDPRLLARNRG